MVSPAVDSPAEALTGFLRIDSKETGKGREGREKGSIWFKTVAD